jgi:D-3-phosphoglycerate dehydrogenase
MNRILVADKLASEALEMLGKSETTKVDVRLGLGPQDLARVIGEYDGIIIRSMVQLTAETLANPGKLRAIARAGVGVDNVDLDAATQSGILVMNTPDANTLSTAEHAIALMMALLRRIVQADSHLRGGNWDRSLFVGSQLTGKTLGIVGVGRVGQAVAARSLGLEMKVLGFDPFHVGPTLLEGRVRMVERLDDLLDQADIVSLHTPKTEETEGLIGSVALSRMKDSAVLINCARGGLVDEGALHEALTSGQIAGAAIDVFAREPPLDTPLLTLPNVVVTPHLGASTVEAQRAVSVDAVRAMLDYLERGEIRSAVNVPSIPLDLSDRDKDYLDLARRMGKILSTLSGSGIESVTVAARGDGLQHLAGVLARSFLVELLSPFFDFPVNLINVEVCANQRSIDLRHVAAASTEDFSENVEATVSTRTGDHSIEGAVFPDGLPRILALDGYRMDMIPEGEMTILFNHDQPGVIGLVGTAFGAHRVNIADLSVSRRGPDAMMVFKIDGSAPTEAIEELRRHGPPIRDIRTVNLPPTVRRDD